MSSYVMSSAGVRVPAILYGTAWKAADTARLVSLAIESGFRGIDTACQPKHYNEPGVGAGIAACLNAGRTRSDLYVQTKFTQVSGHDPRRIPYDPNEALPEQVSQSFAASLDNLQIEYLDCLVLHSPMPTMAETLVAWRAFEALIDAGGVRQGGISNCYELSTLQRLYASARHKPAVLQNRFHAETGYDREIRAFCRDNGLIYQSFWTLTANPTLLAHATVASLASAYQVTPAQVLFRYLSQAGVVPLTGTRSGTHMAEDLSIFDFELTSSERQALDAIIAP